MDPPQETLLTSKAGMICSMARSFAAAAVSAVNTSKLFFSRFSFTALSLYCTELEIPVVINGMFHNTILSLGLFDMMNTILSQIDVAYTFLTIPGKPLPGNEAWQ